MYAVWSSCGFKGFCKTYRTDFVKISTKPIFEIRILYTNGYLEKYNKTIPILAKGRPNLLIEV